MLENKNILVTGGSGFIGKHLVEKLVQYGNKVTCLLLLGEDPSWFRSVHAEIIYGDLTRKDSLVHAVKGKDYIFHLAAQVGGNNTEAFYEVNFNGTRNLVENCKEQNVKLDRFLFVSSIAVTGPSGKDRIFNEETECNPISDYGKSKLMAEQYLNDHKNKFPFSIVRFAMVYGPGSYGGLYAFFKFINKRIFPYFGDGSTNLTYVEDVVNGMINTVKNPNSLYNTYILADNQLYTIKNIQKSISRTTGKKPVKIFVPFQLMYGMAFLVEIVSRIRKVIPPMTRNELVSYMKHRYWKFDTRKALKELNYEPEVEFEEGLEKTYSWYKRKNLI